MSKITPQAVFTAACAHSIVALLKVNAAEPGCVIDAWACCDCGARFSRDLALPTFQPELSHLHLEIESLRADLARVTAEWDALKRRLVAIMPLFEEARDALTAIPLFAARLHNVRLDLADRMDEVGDPARWKARDALSAGVSK